MRIARFVHKFQLEFFTDNLMHCTYAIMDADKCRIGLSSYLVL